jgi:ribonuclease Z
VDLLIVEAYLEARAAPEARPGGELWPQYLREFHIADTEVGRLAASAKPKVLLLHHVLYMGGNDAELLAGIRRGGYTGRVVIAKDLERY